MKISSNLIEEQLEKGVIFKDESKLDVNYIPDQLKHRDMELKMLSAHFFVLIQMPFKVSRKMIITGEVGLGKTVTSKFFGNQLTESAQKRQIKLKCIHINCRICKTSYSVIYNILTSLVPNTPKRGFSTQDLVESVYQFLQKNKIYLFLILDEINYLTEKDPEIVYALTRLTENEYNREQYLSLLGIVRDLTCIQKLDSSTYSSLQRNVLCFKKYTTEQIYDILNDRVSMSFRDGCVSEEILQLISNIVKKSGDIRYGLDLLLGAGKYAELNSLQNISPECVRYANNKIIPTMSKETIHNLPKHHIILLLAIIRGLRRKNRAFVSTSELIGEYQNYCNEIDLDNRKNTQIWEYLKNLQENGILNIITTGKNARGRKNLIYISDAPLDLLEEYILEQRSEDLSNDC